MERSLGDAIYKVADGVSLDVLSEKWGLAPNQLNRWVNGSQPSPRYYDLLQRYLGCSQAEMGALIVETQRRRFLRLPMRTRVIS